MSPELTPGATATISRRAELDLFSFTGPPDWRVTDVSEPFSILLGLTPGEIRGRPLLEFVNADDLEAVSEGLADLQRGFPETLLECRFVQRDKRAVYLQWIARSSSDAEEWRAASTDTADLIELLTERRDLQTRLDLAIGQATAAMWDLNILEDSFTWEPQAAEILGVSPEAIPASGAALAAAMHPADSDAVHSAVAQLLELGSTEVELRIGEEAGLRYLSLRGRILDRDSGGRALRAVGLLLDVTTEKAMEEQLVRMSVSDGLTGIPNRRAFDQALRGEWRRCTRAPGPLSIIMVDIDGFKQFNDRFGHLVGDQALIAVARALTAALHREGDIVARYGGEEFCVVMPDTDTDGAAVVARHLLQAAREVTVRQAPGWNVTVSVGSASWHPGRETIKSGALLGRADEALYVAKRTGKNRAMAYEESLAARDTLHAALALGLGRDELELHYQPVINLGNDDVIGFEALMRWNRPGHGLVAPGWSSPSRRRRPSSASSVAGHLARRPANWRPGNATASMPAHDGGSRSTYPSATRGLRPSSPMSRPHSQPPASRPPS